MYIHTDPADDTRYARCITASKRIRWDADDDVIRGRDFVRNDKFLPDGLSKVDEIVCLTESEKRYLSQIQGRTYANMFGLVERFICAKILEMSKDHWLGNQTALEALIRFCDEELKHQDLFRRIELLIARDMPEGYRFGADPDVVASAVLSKSTWAVLALTLHIELFTQAHYRESIDPDENLSALYKDVFLFHWREESQHAILDELELRRHDGSLSQEGRTQGVDDLIELVGMVDGILQAQTDVDVSFFLQTAGRTFSQDEAGSIKACVLKAYRWQYILSGAQHPHFQKVLGDLISPEQGQRIAEALSPLT